jgi:hypothetical protein
MGLKFNPFSGNFDFTGSGGGGGSSYIDGEVQNFSALPTSTPPDIDAAYLVREAEGTWLLNRKPAGIYIRTDDTGVRADDWTHAGAFPDVFNDANFLLYDNADSSKNLAFQLSGITTGQTRTLTVPDASGTLARTEDFAAPPAIGNTTAAAATFTTLTANTSLTLGTSGILTGGTNLIEQVNSTNGQTFNLYRTTSSANANYERGFIRWGGTSSNTLQIGTEKLGTGAARAMQFQIDGTTRFEITADGNIAMTPAGSGVLINGGNNAGVLAITDGGIRVQGNQGFFVFGSGTYSGVSNVVNNWNNNLAVLVRRLSTGTGDFVDFQDSGSVSKLRINKDGYVVLPTSGGVKIGTATNQLLGFYGVTPVDQPVTVADPSGVTTDEDVEARTAINAIIDRLQELGLIA